MATGSDDFADAPVIGYGGSSDPTPSAALTVEPGEPDTTDSGLNRTAWWKFIAPLTETVGVDLLQTEMTGDPFDYDTVVHVYTGTSVDALILVATGDDNKRMADADGDTVYGYLTEMDFEAEAGVTYYVRVSSYDSAVDMDYVLRLGRRVYSYGDWTYYGDDWESSTYLPETFGEVRGYYFNMVEFEGIPTAGAQAYIHSLVNTMLAGSIGVPMVSGDDWALGFHTAAANVAGLVSGNVHIAAKVYVFDSPGLPAEDMDAEAHGYTGPPPNIPAAILEHEANLSGTMFVGAKISELEAYQFAQSETHGNYLVVAGSYAFRVLQGWPLLTEGSDVEDWNLDHSMHITDIPYHTIGDGSDSNYEPLPGPFFINPDCVDPYGRFVYTLNRPGHVDTPYNYVAAGNAAVEYNVWPTELTYTLHVAGYRYAYPNITGVGQYFIAKPDLTWEPMTLSIALAAPSTWSSEPLLTSL
jgi:hypothetical protein